MSINGSAADAEWLQQLQDRRRVLRQFLLRTTALVVASVLGYVLVPVDARPAAFAVVAIGLLGMAAYVVVFVRSIRSVRTAEHPELHALGALVTLLTLYVLISAVGTLLLSDFDPQAYNVAIDTKIDAFYFTMSTISTVGFGDIVAVNGAARLLVSMQLVLNAVFLALVVRLVLSVGRAEARRRAAEQAATTDDPGRDAA